MSDIPHLLPPSASHLEVALSRAMARLANVPPFCRQMWDPATCPPSHLPWLAWAVSVDEWDSAWSDAQKRGVIEASYQVHRHKGTVGAVRRALAALGYNTELSEWFQWAPEGIPYTFGVTGEIGDEAVAAPVPALVGASPAHHHRRAVLAGDRHIARRRREPLQQVAKRRRLQVDRRHRIVA